MQVALDIIFFLTYSLYLCPIVKIHNPGTQVLCPGKQNIAVY